MSEHKIQEHVKSVIPVYGLGGIFFVYAMIFPMYRVWDPVIAIGVAILGYLLLSKIFPGMMVEVEAPYEATGDKELDQILTQGKACVKRLDQLNQSIQDEEVNGRIVQLEDISRQILDHIAKHPAKRHRINTFMDYYLPTVIKFLDHYAEYDNTSHSTKITGENLWGTQEKIRGSLAQFETAFAHQLDNLYSDKALDIEGDLAVLQSIMKQEGL
ncbi:MAG: 5-bromo-4-chloroindolyl phosphate hydrolysis family protein [Defluviitaleaceae bacterium]|nr:5-bromo-4-chloroindolyl phosphate hydrolysis family protein [Defluviitaleaceae bacterium]